MAKLSSKNKDSLKHRVKILNAYVEKLYKKMEGDKDVLHILNYLKTINGSIDGIEKELKNILCEKSKLTKEEIEVLVR